MTKSMTGFGRAQEVLHGREITVEVRSVNSRYFEYQSRLPRSMMFLDDRLKKTVSQYVSRGKVELYIGVQTIDGGEMQISPNLSVAQGYYDALNAVAQHLKIENDIKVHHVTRFSDVLVLQRNEVDESELAEDVVSVLKSAMETYNAMRMQEGEKLVCDVNQRLESLEEMLGKVEEDSAGRMQRYIQRLEERLREVLADTSIEESRILSEAAIFADKTSVDEETVRLHSHLAQYKEIITTGGTIGRKLDFLTQELNREVNTIGSKCQEVSITRLVVDMKSEVEKIREQIQNLE